jgi:hypothetical protein
VRLYERHPTALNVLYAEIESATSQRVDAFVGTAGAVIERTNAGGFRYYAHKAYDAEGKSRERYVAGPVGDADADATADALRARIHEVKELVPTLRMLGREGFALVDAKTYATLATLHNHRIFEAGGMLIGSHAYGVLLNRLGIRTAPYATEDIDIARREALAFTKVPDEGLLGILRETGIDFVEVPSLDRKKPATSFKQKGRARFHVDLLVPSPDESFPTVPVPELAAHAMGLPYLKYLLAESQTGAVLAREGCCAVRVPLPERFAVHKLIVSRQRSGRSAKSDKDVQQAAVLCAALAEMHPGALEEAVAAIPKRAAGRFKAALESLRAHLPEDHRAWEELTSPGRRPGGRSTSTRPSTASSARRR